jgi:DNA primase
MEIEPVQRAVANAAAPGNTATAAANAATVRADTPQARVEREALKLAIQVPVLAGPMFDAIDEEAYSSVELRTVRAAIAEAGGAVSGTSGVVWIERVRDACGDLTGKALIGELAVEPMLRDGDPDPHYVSVLLARLQWGATDTRIRELKSKVQRINPVTSKDQYLALAGELFSLEQHARALREQAAGGL